MSPGGSGSGGRAPKKRTRVKNRRPFYPWCRLYRLGLRGARSWMIDCDHPRAYMLARLGESAPPTGVQEGE